MEVGEIVYFETPAAWRRWLHKHHAKAAELWVGFHKTSTGLASITWPQSVDEALCYGWIDGQRRSLGETAYVIRFTPRKAGSVWSAGNVKRVGELTALGLMQPAGLAAFELRKAEKSGIYSFEQKPEAIAFDERAEAMFRKQRKAWDFFHRQAPSYRRQATWWVISAKQEATRARRLATLIEDSAAGRRLGHLTRY